MIGRTAYENPYGIAKVNSIIYGKNIDKPIQSEKASYLNTQII